MHRWMGNLPAHATARPITQLAIPGSHDSGTVNLDISLGITDDSPMFYKILAKTDFGRRFIRKWAKTQDLPITQQLKAGIRYLDLRVAYHPQEKQLYIVHTQYARRIFEELKDVKHFLAENPKEVVILDFNHFYNMTTETHNELLDSLRENFGEKCTPPPTETMWSLDDLWNKRYQVISVYDYAREHIPKTHLKTVWPYDFTEETSQKKRIVSPWPNKQSPETLHRFLNGKYEDICKYGYDINQFYVWQGVLTPTGKTILHHPTSTLKDILSLPATREFVNWLEGKENITCIVDFVEHNGFIQKIVDINQI